jgi:SAM-dependent MidA family methyltransferase
MNPLAKQIQNEIEAGGPISFARFMELALYAPGLGYYEREREIGRGGDFFTSVSVGPAFGRLLAFQFADWFASEKNVHALRLVEAGAHDGALAADILQWIKGSRPEIFERLEYHLIEPSPHRRQAQEKKLHDFLAKVKWFDALTPPQKTDDFQIIFSNELLDAMPVHRLVWNAQKLTWDEYRVDWENGQFAWRRVAAPEELLAWAPFIPQAVAQVMPDGYVFEISRAAIAWWETAAQTLSRGKLMAIDYGLSEQELLRPERTNGTLRTYSKHHPGGDLLEGPGEGDITAHVNFSAIEAAGLRAGLKTEDFLEQGIFLTRIVSKAGTNFGRIEEFNPAMGKQFITLVHPAHLGNKFRVLVQSR